MIGAAVLNGTIDGGPDTDTLDYTAYAARAVVNLTAGTATGTNGIRNIESVLGNSVEPPPQLAASITGWQFVIANNAITGISFTTTTTLDPAKAKDLKHYQIISLGKDNRFGTRDDRPIPPVVGELACR